MGVTRAASIYDRPRRSPQDADNQGPDGRDPGDGFAITAGTVKLTDLVPNQRLGKSLSC